MRAHRLAAALLAALLSSAFAATAGADPHAAKGKPHEDPPADMAKAFETWQQMSSPGEQHAYLDQFVGDWDTVSKMWMEGPTRPPMESKGTASIKWSFGGRWLEQRNTGNVMGQPMEGVGYTGYDRMRKQFAMVWLDNMSTAVYSAAGSFDPAGKVLSMYGHMDEPMTGEIGKPVKYVLRLVDEDHFSFEIHDLIYGESNTKMVQIDYARTK